MKNRARSFNSISELYHQFRLGYPTEMYDEIRRICNPPRNLKILEIGVGTGTATKEIVQQFSPELTALEPGTQLCKLGKELFSGEESVRFVCSGFEEYAKDSQYNWIVSATAFHWIDPLIKFEKAASLLDDNGFLIVWTNNYSRDDSPVFEDIAEIYEKLHPNGSPEDGDIRRIQTEKIVARDQEISNSLWFNHCYHKVFERNIPLTGDKYIGLLKTFSNNISLPEKQLESFYLAIEASIERHGGFINLPVKTSLTIAKKT
ncbi:MAG: methyltransferase domain-containing protein [Candidatus Cloacimonetes bacterium]|nr:methyltransferase domain-containing protein [Candidatus Cloacimonadota bacterium]